MATHITLDDDTQLGIEAARADLAVTLSLPEQGMAMHHASIPVRQLADAAGISLREATLRYIAILSYGLERGQYDE